MPLTLINGGLSIGNNLRGGVWRAIPSILVLLAGVSMGFLKPFISTPVFIALVGLSIYLDYGDLYGVMGDTLAGNAVMREIYTYPPLLLLMTLANLLLIQSQYADWLSALITLGVTAVGVLIGLTQV